MSRPFPKRILFDDGFLLPGTTWAAFVQRLADESGLSAQEAERHLEHAEREGWIERVPSDDGSVTIRLHIPEHARPKEGEP